MNSSSNNDNKDYTLGSFLEQQCNYYSDLYAIRSIRDDRPIKITYGKLSMLAKEVAGGLISRGLRPGDSVCLFAKSSIEWVIAWLAIQYCGAIDVAYENNRDAEQILNIVKHTEAKIVFCDHEQILEELDGNDQLNLIHLSWYLPGNFKNNKIVSLYDLRKVGKKSFGLKTRLRQMRSNCKANEAATVFFKRSVDMGFPRGVVHSHLAQIENIKNYALTVAATENDLILSTLPFWHASGRMALIFSFYKASTIFPSANGNFLNDLKTHSPDLVFTNPENLENYYKNISNGSVKENQYIILIRRLYLKICQTWNSINNFIFDGQGVQNQNQFLFLASTFLLLVPLWLILGPIKKLGNKLFLKTIKANLGNNIRHIICGGYKLNSRVDDFFHTIGVTIFESYWLSEAGFAVSGRMTETIGQGDRMSRGTVGSLLPGMALKLIDHKGNDISTTIDCIGQIYIKGDSMMIGYLHEPVLTSETLDPQGWLRTGDRGYLVSTGDLKLLPRQSKFTPVIK